MAKNRGSKSADNGTPSRIPELQEVALEGIDRLQLENLLLITETIRTKKQNLQLRRQALDKEEAELNQDLRENEEARSAFVASHGLDPNKKVDFRDGKLIAVKG